MRQPEFEAKLELLTLDERRALKGWRSVTRDIRSALDVNIFGPKGRPWFGQAFTFIGILVCGFILIQLAKPGTPAGNGPESQVVASK